MAIRGTKSIQQHQRVTTRQKEGVRAAIDATMIVNKLQAHIRDELEMKPTQIKAAEILLDRIVPRLQATTIDTNGSIDLLTILAEARQRVLNANQPVTIEQSPIASDLVEDAITVPSLPEGG